MKKIFSYYLKPYYLRMAVGFLIKFTGTLMDLFLPWTLAYMIDTVIPANQRPEIFLWGFFMIFCSVLAVVFSVAANRMASRVASSAIETIRGDLFEKVSRLSNTEIDRFTRPSLISRLTSDTYNVHQMLGRVQRLGAVSYTHLDVYKRQGTANAIYQNLEFMETYNPDYVLILSGDHIYKMDYEVMLEYHKANNADITIAAMPVPIEEADRKSVV